MKNFNHDYQRRDKIIFRSIDWDEDLGSCDWFENVTLDKLAMLLEENFADRQQAQNNSPTIQAFYEFGKQCYDIGFDINFVGYVISPD